MKPLEVLATLDADILTAEKLLTALRHAREAIAAAYGSTTPTASSAAPPPSRASRRTTRAAATARRSASNEPLDQVFAWLKKQSKPVAINDVVEGTKLSKYYVKQALASLLNDERIEAAGVKSHYRLGLPSVMAAAAKEDL